MQDKIPGFCRGVRRPLRFQIAEDMKRLGQRYITGETDLDELLTGSLAALGHDQISR